MYCVCQHCEEVRKHLEQCDVDADIMLFINERKTGKEKPGMTLAAPCTFVMVLVPCQITTLHY